MRASGTLRFGKVGPINRRPRREVLPALIGFFALCHGLQASPPQKLGDFELTEQNALARSYRFPKTKVTAMTVADRRGSEQLAAWIRKLYSRYAERIDIDGIADVSGVPTPLRGLVREAFRKNLTHPVMLDWGGSVVNRFAYEKGVANIFVIDRRGCILTHVAGSINDAAEKELFQTIDRAITSSPPE